MVGLGEKTGVACLDWLLGERTVATFPLSVGEAWMVQTGSGWSSLIFLESHLMSVSIWDVNCHHYKIAN